MIKSLFLCCLLVSGVGFLDTYQPRELSLETSAAPIEFPQGFFKGVARSFYQDGGHAIWHASSQKTESNWSWFENHAIHANVLGVSWNKRSPIKNGQKVGDSAGGWQRAFDDIVLLKQLGCNAQRFSIEWAEIEPQEGVFNEKALDFYERYCDALLANNITPMVTLHHFVHPLWFQMRGAFECEENIHYFVRYAQKVFVRLGSKVRWWCTINEPTVLSACGYVLGIHPPGKVFQVRKAGLVLKHLLQAHVSTYAALKSMLHGSEAQIGLVHQVLCFEPYRYLLGWGYRFKNPLGFALAKAFNASFAHEVVMRFLQDGIFEYEAIPYNEGVHYIDTKAPQSYDFMGINFYSKVILGFGPTKYDHQIMTDMDYAIRPEALYEAIVQMAALKVPLYITETGVADGRDDRRAGFIQSYMRTIHKAINEGYDVRGVFYWTLLDNYEWNDGFDMKFGLFGVNAVSKERTLKAGGCAYRDQVIVKA